MARQKNATQESFEERFDRLQDIVRKLESGELPLEEGLALFKQGMALSAACREQLEQARHEISILTAEGPAPYAPPEKDEE